MQETTKWTPGPWHVGTRQAEIIVYDPMATTNQQKTQGSEGPWCCSDCLMFMANGPSEVPATVVAAIHARWGDKVHGLAPACAENCEGRFSWSPCGCCGSHMAGDRHPFVYLA